MYDRIKVLNEQNKKRVSNSNDYMCTISKYEDSYCLLDNKGYILLYINSLVDIENYLKNNCDYIKNISVLKGITKFNTYILTEQDWYDICSYLMATVKSRSMLNSFSIIRELDLEKYITKLVLTKKINILIDDTAYKLIMIDNKDLVLVSDLKLKIKDETDVVFFGSFKSLFVSNLDTTTVTDMSYMFQQLYSTENIILKNFNTKKVLQFTGMFKDCKNLKCVSIEELRTDNAIDLSKMFENCFSLVNLNLNGFNVNNVTNFSSMLKNCKSLEILLIDNWNMKQCYHNYIKQNPIPFDALTFTSMFENCSKLKKINCLSLKQLISSSNRRVIETKDMFKGCNLDLIGTIYKNVN